MSRADHAEQIAELSAKGGYTAGATTAGFGAFTLNEWAMIVGIVFTIGTFCVNWFYRHRHYQLEREQRDKPKD